MFVLLLAQPKTLCFTRRLSVCLSVRQSVCLLATSRKNYWSYLHANFITDVSLDKEVPVKFRKSSGPRVRTSTQYLDWIHLGEGPFSPECSVIRMLLFFIRKGRVGSPSELPSLAMIRATDNQVFLPMKILRRQSTAASSQFRSDIRQLASTTSDRLSRDATRDIADSEWHSSQ